MTDRIDLEHRPAESYRLPWTTTVNDSPCVQQAPTTPQTRSSPLTA